jgi:hypothetical protein
VLTFALDDGKPDNTIAEYHIAISNMDAVLAAQKKKIDIFNNSLEYLAERNVHSRLATVQTERQP